MFEKYDLSKTIDGHTFSKKIAPLQEQLGALQRQLRDDHIPVIIVVEGWNAAGITMTVQEIIHYHIQIGLVNEQLHMYGIYPKIGYQHGEEVCIGAICLMPKPPFMHRSILSCYFLLPQNHHIL